jgi:DNA segregation ATPase FtsK/SpoIIIE, S-DNA-T family
VSQGDHGGPVVWRDERLTLSARQRAVIWTVKKARRWTIMLIHSKFGLGFSGVAIMVTLTWFLVSHLLVIIAAGLAVVGLGYWRKRSPETFHRHVTMTVRGLWRGWWVYRRKWGRAMRAATVTHIQGSQLPILLGVRSSPWVDEAEFRLMDGQQPGDYIPNAQRLNTTFRGKSITVERVPDKEDRLRIYALARDPLAVEVPPRPLPTIENLLPRAGLDVAITEKGTPCLLKVLGVNTFIAGYSGAGKSGWLYSIINALHPAMEHGIVRLLGLDPKLNELRLGEHLFHHLVKSSKDRDIQRFFHDCYDLFEDRKSRVGDRFLDPTAEEPLYVMVVDEWAAASVWITDSKIRNDIQTVSKLLLSQSRSCAFSMLAALQDPKKESLPQRDLFQNAIGLRMPVSLVDMVMGDDAWLKGAKCDLIPPMLEGIGYLKDQAILDLDPTKPITIPEPPKVIEFGHLPQWGGFGYN